MLDTIAVMDEDQPLSADEEKLLAELLERQQATEGRSAGVRDLRGLPWTIAWAEAPPGWAYFISRDVPAYLRVSVKCRPDVGWPCS